MFGTLGGPELFLILVIALIVFGPKKLPEIGKNMGRMIGEFRKASQEFQRTIEDEVSAVNRSVEAEKVEQVPRPAAPPPAVVAPEAAEGALALSSSAPAQHQAASSEASTVSRESGEAK